MLLGKRVLYQGNMQTWLSGNHAEQEFIKSSLAPMDLQKNVLSPPPTLQPADICVSGFVFGLKTCHLIGQLHFLQLVLLHGK